MKIQKRVPVPEGHNLDKKYPFLELKEGDSFVVPEADAAKVRTAAQDYKRRYNLHTMTRSFQDKRSGKRYVRVWRIATPSSET